MGCPVVFARAAIDDLQALVRHIANDSPGRAETFGHALVDLALSAGVFPRIGRIVPEAGDPRFREIIHGPYRIIYEVRSDPKAVVILRFWHTARGAPDISKGS